MFCDPVVDGIIGNVISYICSERICITRDQPPEAGIIRARAYFMFGRCYWFASGGRVFDDTSSVGLKVMDRVETGEDIFSALSDQQS